MKRTIRGVSGSHFFAFLLVTVAICLIWTPKSWAPGLSISVTKVCENAVAPGEPITFSGTVTNTGGVPLIITVTDDHAGLLIDGFELQPQQYTNYSGAYIPETSPSTNVVTAVGTYLSYSVQATADATCMIEDGGNEGCTPGYWKNHLDEWAASGYSPEDDFDTVFGVDYFSPDITLEDAVNLGGGGVRKLARHGTAALISAAHPGVDYPLDVYGVICAVQAFDADTLVEYNELGCPLN